MNQILSRSQQWAALVKAKQGGKITGAKTRLERQVQKWCNDYEPPNSAITLIAEGSVEIGPLSRIFQTHRREISTLFAREIMYQGKQAEVQIDGWHVLDPLAQEEPNRAALARWAVQTCAKRLAERNGITL